MAGDFFTCLTPFGLFPSLWAILHKIYWLLFFLLQLTISLFTRYRLQLKLFLAFHFKL